METPDKNLNFVAAGAFDVHEVGVGRLHDTLLLVASSLGVQGRVQEVNLQRHLENPTASNLNELNTVLIPVLDDEIAKNVSHLPQGQKVHQNYSQASTVMKSIP